MAPTGTDLSIIGAHPYASMAGTDPVEPRFCLSPQVKTIAALSQGAGPSLLS